MGFEDLFGCFLYFLWMLCLAYWVQFESHYVFSGKSQFGPIVMLEVDVGS
jgi:hypothetical protein